jgi:hypothetical protein
MGHSASKRGASIALFIIYVQFNHCIAVLDIFNSIQAAKRLVIGIGILMVAWASIQWEGKDLISYIKFTDWG